MEYKGLVLFILISILLNSGVAGDTGCFFVDAENTCDNAFEAWRSALWSCSDEGDFNAGILSNVDVDSSPGDVVLEYYGGYAYSGTLNSGVFDSGADNSSIDSLFWDETFEMDTDVIFEVRASDILFLKDDASPAWIHVGGTSPVDSGLPSGRYIQWRATLTTTDDSKTPVLHEVRIYYSDY